MFIGVAPAGLSYLTNKPCTAYNLKNLSAIEALFFGTRSRLILQASLLYLIAK